MSPCQKPQREVWAEYHSDTSESRDCRRIMGETFKELFPEGHKTSIKHLLKEGFTKLDQGEELTEDLIGLGQIHPKARQLLLEFGKDYHPISFRNSNLYDAKWEPTVRRCYYNSTVVMIHGNGELDNKPIRPYTYVEGVVYGHTVHAILHAWVGQGFSQKCLDPTFYARTHWYRYFGIPFTQEEHKRIWKVADLNSGMASIGFGLLFGETFERTEATILEVLQQPRTSLRKRNGNWDWTLPKE